MVESLDASFKAGSSRDLQVLVVSVTEGAPISAGFRVANDRSPTVGGQHGQLEFGAQNLLGRTDEFNVTLGRSAGLDDYELRFRVPITASGTEVSVRYGTYDSTLVEDQFAVFGANTTSQNYEVSLLQPVWRSAQRQVALSARYTHRQSQSFLLGKPYSFSAEADKGLVKVGALRLGAQWTERLPRNVLSLRLTASIGVNGTEHPGAIPDSRFVAGFAQAQWLRVLGPRLGQLILRGDLQVASEPLVSLERFALGGTSSVRGYRRSRLVNDSGWTAAMEHRLPLVRLALPGGAEGDGQLWFVSFLDVGEAWSERPGARQSPTLVAFGPGLRWDASKKIRAEFYWGALRNRVRESDPDLQDSGFHFMVTARIGY